MTNSTKNTVTYWDQTWVCFWWWPQKNFFCLFFHCYVVNPVFSSASPFSSSYFWKWSASWGRSLHPSVTKSIILTSGLVLAKRLFFFFLPNKVNLGFTAYVEILIVTMRARGIIVLFIIFLLVFFFPNIPIPMLCGNKHFESAFLLALVFSCSNPNINSAHWCHF